MNGQGHAPHFAVLLAFLARVPAISSAGLAFGSGRFENDNWWVKLSIDIKHPLAWNTVQELGHVLNYLSPDERLPALFMPVSPPPYLNGGPEFLCWVIESRDPSFTPDQAAEWLAGRLPQPVDDPAQWPADQQD